MKKRMLSLFLTLALCLGLLPVTALAENGDLVATVETSEGKTEYKIDTTYATPEAALQAAWDNCMFETATLTIHQNVTMSQQLKMENTSTNLTLCMDDGVKLTSTYSSNDGFLDVMGILDFKSGTIQAETPAIGVYSKSAVVTLSGGNIVVNDSSQYGVFISLGTFNMTGGSIEATGSGSDGVRLSSGNASANISGGTISAGRYGINAGNGNLDISGDAAISSSGTYALFTGSSAKVQLSGGTFSGNNYSIWAYTRTAEDLLMRGYAYYDGTGDKISNAKVEKLSSSVTVKLDSEAELSIIKDPQHLNLEAGSCAEFSVEATGSYLTYQWQVSNDGGNSWDDIADATEDTYTIDTVEKNMNGWRYRCVVSNSSKKATSQAAVLTVYAYYTLTIVSGKINGENKASIRIKDGDMVTIQADPAPDSTQRFKEWTWDITDQLNFVDNTSETSSTATFTMPASNVTVTATYEKIPKYTLTVVNGTGSNSYKEGNLVGIGAVVPEGYVFKEWIWDTSKVPNLQFFNSNKNSQNAGIYMPACDFTITATFTQDGNEYTLSVDGGTGGGTYNAGRKVSITADTVDGNSMPFWKWMSSGGGTFENDTYSSTTFTMPNENVTVTPKYYDKIVKIDGFVSKNEFLTAAALPESVTLNGKDVPVTWECSSLDNKENVTESGGYVFKAQYTGSKPAGWPDEGIEYGVVAKQTMVQVWLSRSIQYDGDTEELTVAVDGKTYALSFDAAEIKAFPEDGYVYVPESALVKHTDSTGKQGYRLYMTITGEGAENIYPVLRSTPGYQYVEDYKAGGKISTVNPESYLSDAKPGKAQYTLLVTIDRYGAKCVTFASGAPFAFEGTGSRYSITFNGDAGSGRNYQMSAVSGDTFGNLGRTFFTVTPPSGEERAWAVLIVPTDRITNGSGSGVTIDTSWGRSQTIDMYHGHSYYEYSLFQNSAGQFAAVYLTGDTTAVISELKLTEHQPGSVAPGETAALSVTAAYQHSNLKDMPDVIYQWYTCNQDGSNAQAIPDANDATYTTSALTAGEYYYYVTAKFDQFEESNSYQDERGTLFLDNASYGWSSNTVTTSNVITVTVGSAADLSATVNQTIFQAGESLTVNATVTGTAGTTPTGKITLYWGDPTEGGKPIAESPLSNATAAVEYTITQADVGSGPDKTLYIRYSGDGNYRSATESEKIHLVGGLTITAIPQNGQVTVTWEKPSELVTGYKLWVSPKEGIVIGPNPIEIGKNETAVVVNELPDGTSLQNEITYTFYMEAYYPGGEVKSNIAEAAPLTSAIYELTVDLDGSNGSNVSGAYAAGQAIPLNAGTKPGYVFTGWSSTGGGTFADASSPQTTFTMPAESVTVKAIFVRSSSGGGGVTRYQITVEETEHGKVTSSYSRASQGSTVTLTIALDEGYELASLTITKSNGEEIKFTDKGSGKFTFTMPGSNVTVEAVFKAGIPGYSDCPRDKTCPIWPFTDTSTTAWYHDGVHFCLENGMMDGYGNGIFGPNEALSRAMLVQILYAQEGYPAVSSASVFDDVAVGAWYADAVNWAAKHNIVGGYDSGRFGPNDSITREQLAAILWRYAQYKGYDVSVGESTNILSYTDALTVSEYAIPAMQWAVGVGIISGDGDGSRLNPQSSATRAQTATMLMRFCEECEL